MINIGLDIGLRSNGLIVQSNEKILDLCLVQTFNTLSKKQKTDKRYIIKQNEDIIVYNLNKIHAFIKPHINDAIRICIEGLSYNSISSSKDLLAGLHWATRAMIIEKFGIHCEIVYPLKWRAGHIKHYDRVQASLKYDECDPIDKLIMYHKLNDRNRHIVDKYVGVHGLTEWSFLDLSDAYWISRVK